MAADSSKTYCSVVDGLTYSDRCLWKLSKMIDKNKTCESCLLFKLEQTERKLKEALGTGRSRPKAGSARNKKRFGIKDTSDTKGTSDAKDIKTTREKIETSPEKEPRPAKGQGTTEEYTCQDLVDLSGKFQRRLRKLAQEGKIPAHKVNGQWHFHKSEIDNWLLAKKEKPFSPCVDGIPTASVSTQEYTCKELIGLLGKSRRRIQELAQEGKIPARKGNKGWCFPKKEIDGWLSKKEKPPLGCVDVVGTTSAPMQGEDILPPNEGAEETQP